MSGFFGDKDETDITSAPAKRIVVSNKVREVQLAPKRCTVEFKILKSLMPNDRFFRFSFDMYVIFQSDNAEIL